MAQRALKPIEAPPRKQVLVSWPLDRVEDNPWQPRQYFGESELDDLEKSIEERGQMQPGLGRPKPGDPHIIQICEGGRRKIVLLKLGIKEMSFLVSDYTDEEMADFAVAANRDRVGNNPMELALAYKRQKDEFGWTDERIATKAGKSRPVISNLMRLLELPEDVQQLIGMGKLSEAHGKALAGYKDFPAVASALAGLTLANAWPSKALEKWPQLDYEQRGKLIADGVMKELPWQLEDVWAECKKCPFNAMRSNSSMGRSFCLKPEHYAELTVKEEANRLAAKAKDPQNTADEQKREAARQAKEAAELEKRRLLAERNTNVGQLAGEQLELTRKRTIASDSIEDLRAELVLIFVSRYRGNGISRLESTCLKWGIDLDAKFLESIKYGPERDQAIRVALDQLRTADIVLLMAASDILNDVSYHWSEPSTALDYVRAGQVDEEAEFPVF